MIFPEQGTCFWPRWSGDLQCRGLTLFIISGELMVDPTRLPERIDFHRRSRWQMLPLVMLWAGNHCWRTETGESVVEIVEEAPLFFGSASPSGEWTGGKVGRHTGPAKNAVGSVSG